MNRLALTTIALILAACSKNERLAMIDQPVEPPEVAEIVSRSQGFAERHNLAFVDHIKGGDGYLALRNRELNIQSTIHRERLQVVILGQPTPQAREMADRYINEVVPNGPHITIGRAKTH